MDLKELQGWEGDIGSHWYYASKAAALERLLKPVGFGTIADIGAGSGFFSKHLLVRRADARAAACVDINYARDSDEWIAGKHVAFRRSARAVSADLYLLMDVLEHVEDDVALLRSVAAGAPPGAHFVVTVPAFNFLWSGHDVYLGHHRRYTLDQVASVVRRAGLVVRKRCYFFGAVFPAAVAVRISRRLFGGDAPPKSDMVTVSDTANRALRTVCRLEESAFMLNRLFGLTAFVLAVRAS